MTQQELQEKLTTEQELYVKYLAAGRQSTSGKKYTEEQFAELIGVNPATLWRWRQKPEFKKLVLDESMTRLVEFIPAMNKAMVRKAIEKGDVQAYMAIMRQAELLKAEKQEIKHEVTSIDAALSELN